MTYKLCTHVDCPYVEGEQFLNGDPDPNCKDCCLSYECPRQDTDIVDVNIENKKDTK